MAPLWGQSREDRDRMLSAVRTLGTTSVPGLAAVLAVSERKAERWVREAVRERVAGLRFNPVIQSVWWEDSGAARLPPNPPPPTRQPVPVPAAGPAPPLPAFPESVRPTASPAVSDSLSDRDGRAAPTRRCGACRILMVPTGEGDRYCCPQCGRLTSRADVEPAPPPPLRPHELPLAALPASSGSLAEEESAEAVDRRTQELLAAWVLGRPIPCPKCRSSLHHRGFGEYACPGCGEQVRFAVSGGFASSVTRTAGAPPERAPARAPTGPVSPATNPS